MRYRTERRGALLMSAARALALEGVPNIPDWWDTNVHQIKRGANSGMYAGDFTLYVDGGVVHSPYRSAHKSLRGQDVYAATFNQWGLMLGAMFETDPYLWVSGYAPERTKGAFSSSEALFHAATLGQFRLERWDTVSTCTLHRWVVTQLDDETSISICSKCQHKHNFGIMYGTMGASA